jgi:hypothetical protein
VKTDLVDAARWIVRPEPATTHMLVGFQKKYGPVLLAKLFLTGDLCLQAFLDLLAGQLSPGIDETRDSHIAPEPKRDGQVIFTPVAKAQSGRLDEKTGLIEIKCHLIHMGDLSPFP